MTSDSLLLSFVVLTVDGVGAGVETEEVDGLLLELHDFLTGNRLLSFNEDFEPLLQFLGGCVVDRKRGIRHSTTLCLLTPDPSGSESLGFGDDLAGDLGTLLLLNGCGVLVGDCETALAMIFGFSSTNDTHLEAELVLVSDGGSDNFSAGQSMIGEVPMSTVGESLGDFSLVSLICK